MDRIYIKDYPLQELEDWVERIGERRFRARQIYRHLYVRHIVSWDQCTDLSRTFRTQLEFGTFLDAMQPVETVEAEDGTRKYLFRLHDGHLIESVLIPDPPRFTVCLSTQVGCAMGCRFCLTATLGFTRNLTTAEIVDQVCQIQRHLGRRTKITNLVFMGMGEPLANEKAVFRALDVFLDRKGFGFSHRRITLSTVGLVPALERLGRQSPVNLAISLHAADNGLRTRLMPVNRTYPLDQLMEACRAYPLASRKRITFEYVLLAGINDAPEHAKGLVKLLRGVRSKVNLIPLNPHPDIPFRRPSDEEVQAFQKILLDAGMTATVRQSRGSDIRAACGQLAARWSPGQDFQR